MKRQGLIRATMTTAVAAALLAGGAAKVAHANGPMANVPVAGPTYTPATTSVDATPVTGSTSTDGVTWDGGTSGSWEAPRTVFRGHGGFDPFDGNTTIPPGTTLTTYAHDGEPITNLTGKLIGADMVPSFFYQHTFQPGDVVPNYTLYPTDWISWTTSTDTTVDTPTRLGDLLKPNMGDCHWAACLTH